MFVRILLLIITLGCSFALWVLMDQPCGLMLFIWSMLSILWAVSFKKNKYQRLILLNIGFILGILLVFEIYFWQTSRISNYEGELFSYDGDYTDKDYFCKHETFGYLGIGNVRITSRKFYDDKLLYDVVYSTDTHGFRVSPPQNTSTNAIYFFGGSFTYGEGVNDFETIPYQVGVMNTVRHSTFNFGFHGYGPHQMLAGLENGVFKKIAKHPPRYVICQVLAEHGKRVSGLSSWDTDGPKYILDVNTDELVRTGSFSDNKLKGRGKDDNGYNQLINKSALALRMFVKREYTTRSHIDLLVAILIRSRNIVESSLQGVFHVILWDVVENRQNLYLIERLREVGFRIHLVSNIIPSFYDKGGLYAIKQDGHPTSLCNNKVAEYISKEILKRESS